MLYLDLFEPFLNLGRWLILGDSKFILLEKPLCLIKDEVAEHFKGVSLFYLLALKQLCYFCDSCPNIFNLFFFSSDFFLKSEDLL